MEGGDRLVNHTHTKTTEDATKHKQFFINADKRQKLTHFGQKGNLKEENNEEHKGFNVTVPCLC